KQQEQQQCITHHHHNHRRQPAAGDVDGDDGSVGGACGDGGEGGAAQALGFGNTQVAQLAHTLADKDDDHDSDDNHEDAPPTQPRSPPPREPPLPQLPRAATPASYCSLSPSGSPTRPGNLASAIFANNNDDAENGDGYDDDDDDDDNPAIPPAATASRLHAAVEQHLFSLGFSPGGGSSGTVAPGIRAPVAMRLAAVGAGRPRADWPIVLDAWSSRNGGGGVWSRHVAAAFPTAFVVGVSPDPPVAAPGDPPNLTFQIDDVREGLSFPDGYFDLTVMHLFGSSAGTDDTTNAGGAGWPAVLAELARVTRPGGYVELVEASAAASVPASRSRAAPSDRGDSDDGEAGAALLARACRAAGLAGVRDYVTTLALPQPERGDGGSIEDGPVGSTVTLHHVVARVPTIPDSP
ncbi:hypothetical protein HK405_006920, partial [Cladochytrium tenue]